MFNKKQFSIIVLLSIISLIFAGIAFADNYYFAYSQVPSNFSCSEMRVRSSDGTISYSLPKNAKIAVKEYINGSHYMSMNGSLGGHGSQPFPIFSSIFPSPQSYPYVYTVKYTVKASKKVVSEASLSVKCIDAQTGIVISNSVSFVGEDGEAAVAMPPDDRFNWGTGDANIAIVYPEGDSIGIYLYDGEQYIANFVTADDIVAYKDNAPAENTLIASAGAVNVYVLTTGEISFIIGPDAEGKQYVLIMTDLNGSDAYGYEV